MNTDEEKPLYKMESQDRGGALMEVLNEVGHDLLGYSVYYKRPQMAWQRDVRISNQCPSVFISASN